MTDNNGGPAASSPEQTSLNADDDSDGGYSSEQDKLLPQPNMGPGVVTKPGASPVKGFCAALVPTPAEGIMLLLFLVNYIMAYLSETFCHTVHNFRYFCLGTTYLQATPIRLLSLFIYPFFILL